VDLEEGLHRTHGLFGQRGDGACPGARRVTNASFEDEHPFSWFDPEDPGRLRETFTPLLARVVDGISRGQRVLDVGCGGGRVMIHLGAKGVAATGVDISLHSLREMCRHSGRPGVRADNQRLPFRDGAADVVISDGVVHHTPNPQGSFGENCRVLRPGGRLYLAVYRPGGHYELIMKTIAKPLRWALPRPVWRQLVHVFVVPLYWLARSFKTKRASSFAGVRNLFYDYIARPIIRFVPRDEVERWAEASGVRILDYDPNLTENVHCFIMAKPEAQE
jgi:SAM-dependent methyltransferase